jgi:DNA-binding MarR family transcriptional regulator
VTELERRIVDQLREAGPSSGSEVARKIGARKQLVLQALRALEGAGTVRHTRKAADGAGPGSRRRWKLAESKRRTPSRRRGRPGVSIYLSAAVDAEVLLAALEPLGDELAPARDATRRALARWREREACGVRGAVVGSSHHESGPGVREHPGPDTEEVPLDAEAA